MIPLGWLGRKTSTQTKTSEITNKIGKCIKLQYFEKGETMSIISGPLIIVCVSTCSIMDWVRISSKLMGITMSSTDSRSRPRWLSWMRRPTGDQEVAGSTPAEVGNILSWRLIMKYFLRSFSPFRWFKKGSCQFLAKECAQYWLTA